MPADRLLAETDSPYLAPQPVRGRPQRARVRRCTRSPRSPRRAARTSAELERADRRERDRRLRAVSVVPKKQLGQHFLVDENILGVIGRLAELAARRRRARDRPGPRRPHALPRRRASPTSTRSSSTARSSRSLARHPAHRRSTGGTRSRSTSARSSRRPAKLVANLPYNIATPLVVESLDRLPAIELWCVMVQREVADRFFAVAAARRPTARSRCSSSSRPSAPASIRSRARSSGPRPNVDSALVAFRAHRARASTRRSSALVEAAFAHRRKTLANSLALAGRRVARAGGGGARGDRPRPGGPRRGARAAGVRRARSRARVISAAGAGEDQPRARRRPDAARRAARGRDDPPADRPLRHDHARAGRASSRVEGFADDTLVRRALEARRRRGRRRAALARPDREADPGRGRARRRQLRRRDRARARERARSTSRCPPSGSHELARGLGADVPFFLEPGPQLGTGDGDDARAARPAAGLRGAARCCPHGDAQGVDRPRSTARFDGARAGFAERRARVLEVAARRPRRRPRRAAAERPRALAARRRAARARRVPGRRQRRRARPSTGSSDDRAGAERAAAALAAARRDLGREPCVVAFVVRWSTSADVLEHAGLEARAVPARAPAAAHALDRRDRGRPRPRRRDPAPRGRTCSRSSRSAFWVVVGRKYTSRDRRAS